MTKVVPSLYTNQDGNSSFNQLFAYPTCRTQVLYRSGALGNQGGVLLGVNFRADGLNQTQTYSARNWPIKVEGYTSPLTPRTMNTSFAANRGSGGATTLFNGNLNLPALPPVTLPPAPFVAKVLFTQPFPFTVSQGDILLEFIGSGTGSHLAYRIDGESRPMSAGGFASMMGMYCRATNGDSFKFYPVETTWVLNGAATVDWKAGGPTVQSMVNWIGLSNSSWGTMPLPFDLTPLGATGCIIYTNWLTAQAASLGTFPMTHSLQA